MRSAPVRKISLHLEVSLPHESEAIVRCTGRLVAENTCQLKQEVAPLIERHHRVVLDLTKLESMDSSGLGAIIKLYCSAKAHGRELRLINLNKRVQELLGITNVLSALTCCGEYMIKTP